MNMMNGWALENLSQDSSAIRQFCAARVEEQEQEQDQWAYYDEEELDIWSSLDFMPPPQPASSAEVEELVDTFFNAEYYEEEDNAANLKLPEEDENENEDSDHLQQDDAVSIMDYEANTTTAIGNGVDEGLQLVHLLLGCAEAVGCRDARLADSILARIWPCVTPCGDSLQRVSYCFAVGLKSRLSLLHNVNPNGSFSTRPNCNNFSTITRQEKLEAFALLHRTTPYVAFGFAAANDAICRAATGKDSLHVIDLGMEHNLQWPSLVRKLSSRPPKSLRITGLIPDDRDPSELESSMRGLREEASALGIALEYKFMSEQISPSTLTRQNLQLREGETVFVNSIMQLHKHVRESRGSLKAILQSIRRLGPALLTVVEQDANHNGPFFLGRFLESLHYYSAVFDSLDAGLPRDSCERMRIERVHLAEEICNVVACEGGDRVERHERADQWRRQLGRAGFQAAGFECLSEVKTVVGGYGCDGYTVGSQKGCLQLGWKGRPIMLASAWHLNNLP